MRRLFAGCLLLAALSACGEAPPTAEPQPDPAARLVAAAVESGRPPDLDYACDIWEPRYSGPSLESQEESAVYGDLSVREGRYRLVLADGRTTEGTLSVGPEAALTWEGDLGPIDDAPRRVTRAGLTAYDDVANLYFDFEPATETPVPHRQVICRATFGTGAEG